MQLLRRNNNPRGTTPDQRLSWSEGLEAKEIFLASGRGRTISLDIPLYRSGVSTSVRFLFALFEVNKCNGDVSTVTIMANGKPVAKTVGNFFGNGPSVQSSRHVRVALSLSRPVFRRQSFLEDDTGRPFFR